MFIVSSLLTLLRRVDRAASERLTQQQLQRLDAHLLRDIGFIHHDGRIVPLQGDCPELLEQRSAVVPTARSAAQPSQPVGVVDSSSPPLVRVT